MNQGPPGEHELYDYLVFRELEEKRRQGETIRDEDEPPEEDGDEGYSP